MLLKRYKYLVSAFIVSIFVLQTVKAQSTFTITGNVISNTDGAIVCAQVFIDGSTIGTLTDKDGKFILNDIPSGIYDLFVRSLGYNSASISINTDNLEAEYQFTLSEQVYELDEITVKPDPENRKINLQEFKRAFLGVGPYSYDTKILNEEVLRFDFDPKASILSAYSNERLEIENKGLGYKIYFYLDEFSIHYKQQTTFYFGQTLFQPLNSRRKKTRNKWASEREKAYKSSFTYFVKSLINQNIEENGFIVKGEQRDEDATYISKDTVSSKLYFGRVDSTTFKISFINFLNVTNTQIYEDLNYLQYIAKPFDSNPRMLPDFQNSSFTMIEDSVLIDKSGYIINPKGLLFDGYWGFHTISDMLPIGYSLPD